MTQFDRQLTGWRYVDTLFGDTLQAIAARELRDATQWAQIANINGLKPPYLTGNPGEAGPNVLLYGQQIVVPASQPTVSATVDPNAVYGVDVGLRDGMLSASGGDFDLVSGRDNLRQALHNRIITNTGELAFHLDYGCAVRRLLGAVNGPSAGLLAAEFVSGAMQNETRVDSVDSVLATVSGDALLVEAVVTPQNGAPINLSIKV